MANEPENATEMTELELQQLNEQKTKELAKKERELAKKEKIINENANANAIIAKEKDMVSIYCGCNLARGIDLTIQYDGKTIKFDNMFQRKTMSIEEFKNFAGSYEGQKRIDNRHIIVGGDVPDDILDAWDIRYKKGEVLDKPMLNAIFDIDAQTLKNVFIDLCTSHQLLVLRKFIDGFEERNPYVTKEKLMTLNEITKSIDGVGALKHILEEMDKNESKNY